MAITINDAALFVRWMRQSGREVDDYDAHQLHRLYLMWLRLLGR